MSIAARCNCRLIAPGAFSCRCGPGGFSFACFRRCEVRNDEGGCGIAGLPAARFGAGLGFHGRGVAGARRHGACRLPEASGLRQVRAVGQVLPFDDEVGYSALLLQGRYPQPHMQGRQGRELCLYRRATGKASVSEADALLKP